MKWFIRSSIRLFKKLRKVGTGFLETQENLYVYTHLKFIDLLTDKNPVFYNGCYATPAAVID